MENDALFHWKGFLIRHTNESTGKHWYWHADTIPNEFREEDAEHAKRYDTEADATEAARSNDIAYALQTVSPKLEITVVEVSIKLVNAWILPRVAHRKMG
jgi:hypothetical protein